MARVLEFTSGAEDRAGGFLDSRDRAIAALSVAVLTFVGGTFSGIAAAVWYLSTLATTDDVDMAMGEVRRPLSEAVDGLSLAVGDLQSTVAGLAGLRGTVDRLHVAVGDLQTS